MDLEEARRAYLLARVGRVFVAEAAPDDPERFFYNPNVRQKDWLYLYLMTALYGLSDSTAGRLRLRATKAEMLARFRDDGNYLVDALDYRLLKGTTSAARTRLIRAAAPGKIVEIAALLAERGTATARVVLIKATVFDGMAEGCAAAGLPLANRARIPFPSSGQQKAFLAAMAATLAG